MISRTTKRFRKLLEALPLIAFLALVVFVQADDIKDPLLDAKINFVTIQQRYGIKHPKYLEAQAHLDAVAKVYSTSDPAYVIHLRQRLKDTEIEQADLKFRYSEKHQKILAINAKLDFLRQELRQLEQKPTQ